MLWSILLRDLFTKFVWLEDEMVWNLMECRKFEVHSDCRASRTPIGAMFPWSPKGHVLQRFSAQDCSFRKEFLDLKVIVYWVTFKLGFLEHFFFLPHVYLMLFCWVCLVNVVFLMILWSCNMKKFSYFYNIPDSKWPIQPLGGDCVISDF